MNILEPILLLRSGKSLFAIELRYVREIISTPPTFPLPIRLPDISHLALLRGTPYAVLNSEYYLQIEHEIRDRLVVLIAQMAVFADEAVQTISPDQLANYQADSEPPAPFIKSVAQFRNRIIPILDIQVILNDQADFEYIPI